MNEVYGICINRNLILSRSLLSPRSSSLCIRLVAFYRTLLLILLLLSLSALLSLSPPCLILYPAFSNFLGSSLIPSGEMYKAVERRMPLKSRPSVDFCRGTELETLLSLSFSSSLFVSFSASHTTVRALSLSFSPSFSPSFSHISWHFFRTFFIHDQLVCYLPYAFNLFALALLLANIYISRKRAYVKFLKGDERTRSRNALYEASSWNTWDSFNQELTIGIK